MRYLLFLISFMVVSGCAMHAPMSEMVMFHEKESKEKGSYSARYSHAIGSFTLESYSESKLKAYASENKPLDKGTYEPRPETGFSTHPIFMYEDTDRFAVSASVGNGIGGDITLKLPAKLYLTGSGGGSGGNFQGQFILQRRLADGNPAGFSLGTTVRQQVIGVPYEREEKCTSLYCGLIVLADEATPHYFQTTSVGIRGVLMLSGSAKYGDSRGFIYLTASYNYDLDIETGYPKIGLAVGFY